MLTRYNFDNSPVLTKPDRASWKRKILFFLNNLLPENLKIFIVGTVPDMRVRLMGEDWPREAETMIGLTRLDQLHDALDTVRIEGIRGDIVEAGVWRGGAMIFAKAYLETWQIHDKKVFLADSFRGLPKPDDRYPVDRGDIHFSFAELAITKKEVETNFEKYGINPKEVIFLEGWFEDTLPSAPIKQISILRMDGDMYSSTIQTLNALFDKVCSGGFVIVDDYYLKGARAAVKDFLELRNIKVEIHHIDKMSAFFRVE